MKCAREVFPDVRTTPFEKIEKQNTRVWNILSF